MSLIRKITAIALLLLAFQLHAAPVRVAVASNFSLAMQAITQEFEQQSGHTVELIFGSTGKIYAQILNGAPFDAFFAADVDRPRLLEQAGMIRPGSRFSYAIGKILLWSPDDTLFNNAAILQTDHFHHLAIANPRLAPYGKAAQQVLQAEGSWETLQNKIVRGENIGQTFQFVKSGVAELGFVACSQVSRGGHILQGSYWKVPREFYSPIEQQAVLLKDSALAREFLATVRDNEAIKIIQEHGYGTP